MANEMKHIEGPWSAVLDEEDGDNWRIYGTTPNGLEGCYLVAEVFNGNGNPRNAVNKALILAAPELLEALQECTKAWHEEDRIKAWDKARAAIAKATGA